MTEEGQSDNAENITVRPNCGNAMLCVRAILRMFSFRSIVSSNFVITTTGHFA